MPFTAASRRIERFAFDSFHVCARGQTLLLVALLAGCAHQRARAPRSVALMPVDTMGVPAAEGTALHRALSRELAASSAAHPAPASEVERALAGESRGQCGESDDCLARVGRRVSAPLVLSSTLAGLGEMRLVRARVVRARDALVVQDLQQNIAGGPAALDSRAADLVRRLFPERAGRPWYRRWWVWVTVAGVVGTAAGVTTWLALRSGSTERDPSLVHLGDL